MRGGDCRRFAEPSLESARETREIPERNQREASQRAYFSFSNIEDEKKTSKV